ncbi:P-selectin isoform X2 [Chaetodon auriga]|uniref:P-selectin isoform X2 n=1 Tax=Chaetodon auriga TaxID=39042 RepID=UPI004032A6E0
MTNEMMFQDSVDTRQSLHHRVLIAAFIVFVHDLSGRGGAQAWTYSYSISPNRGWLEASQWCQQHFADMVVIQNQEEADFLNNLLPFNQKYYWIGIRNVGGGWIRYQTHEKVPEEAQNWAAEEPDNIAGQDCVEIYIKRDKDTTKWNNENCRKNKGTVCYTASCTQDSCSAHADCVETIGNFTCKCHRGFQGSGCDEAIACKPLLDPEQGSHYCFHPYGSNRFNSSCLLDCELGFQLVGVPQLLCQASGDWNHPVPVCQAEQCPVLNHTSVSAGSMNCSHPIAPNSYNSTCEVRCDEGYEPSGQDQIRCDHTGQWTASVPSCTKKKCSPILFPVTGNMTCVDTLEPFSFGSWCKFTCQEGYDLTGDNTLTCLASGRWSKATPTCTVVQCNSLMAPPHAFMQCQDPLGVHSYGSMCTVQCEEGFDLIGTNMTKCSSRGSWSHALPVCQVRRCNPINPPHGSLTCSDPNGSFSFGSRCMATCDEGFLLNGTASTECNSLGMWSADIPQCLVKRCPTLNSPLHGSFICSDPHAEFSFGSQCNITCEEGFVLSGTADTECTSMAEWSADIPRCLAKRCPTLNSPSHGSFICSDPYEEFSFGSRCNITCEEGFHLNGMADTECSSMGTWSTDIPQCLVKRCPTLKSPSHGSLICSDPHEEFSFGSRCNITCEKGFILNGTADTECTSVGKWSADIPHCLAKRCPTLNSPPHGSLFCSGPHGQLSFGSRCTSTCEEGFVLNGTADTECTSLGRWSTDIPRCFAKRCSPPNSCSHGSLVCSAPHGEFSFGSQCTSTCDAGFVLNGTADTECTSLGRWSTDIPCCHAHPCPLLAKAPQHGRMNCSHPYSAFSYGSHCDFECNEGFWLRGTSVMTCNTSGHWNQDLPTCRPVQCEAIRVLPLALSMNCSHPLGNFSFGSQCLFTCKDGFSLNGTEALFCSSTGFWSDSLPKCAVEGMPVGTAMLMYAGVGAASVVVLLILIGLFFFIVTRFKKRGNTLLHDGSVWEDRENPAFES